MSIIKALNEARSYGRDSWDSNMPGYQGDYGGAENFGRRKRDWDENDAIDARLRQQHAQKQEYEKSGKFWLKLKDTQRHLPAGPFTGKQAANTAALELLKQQPELKGNLVITAYGPDETQGVMEYGDTAKGQKMLAKVHHRAADRVTSKQADKDPAYARKAQQTQDRAWDRLAVKEQGMAEAEQVDSPKFQSAVSALKQMAQQGERKTVWDPVKRVYKTVPVNTPKKEEGVAEGSEESVSFREMVDVVDQHYPKYYAELSGSDISDKQFERAIVNAYKAIIKKQGVAEAEDVSHLHKALDRALSKEKKASPVQVQRNKERWAKRQAEKEQGNKDMKIDELAINEDWQKVNKSDKTDGMSRKAVKAYRRENPGSKLKTAVTTKPSKLKKGSKAAKRRKSFCARMSGMKKAHASAKTKRDPDSPINKALRRWNCE